MHWSLTEGNEVNEELGRTSFPSLPSVTGPEVDQSCHLGAAGFTPEISNQSLEAMTRSALALLFQVERLWRAPRHASAFALYEPNDVMVDSPPR